MAKTGQVIPSEIPSLLHLYFEEPTQRLLIHNPDADLIAVYETIADAQPYLDLALERGFKLELVCENIEINLDGRNFVVFHMYDLLPPNKAQQP